MPFMMISVSGERDYSPQLSNPRASGDAAVNWVEMKKADR